MKHVASASGARIRKRQDPVRGRWAAIMDEDLADIHDFALDALRATSHIAIRLSLTTKQKNLLPSLSELANYSLMAHHKLEKQLGTNDSMPVSFLLVSMLNNLERAFAIKRSWTDRFGALRALIHCMSQVPPIVEGELSGAIIDTLGGTGTAKDELLESFSKLHVTKTTSPAARFEPCTPVPTCTTQAHEVHSTLHTFLRAASICVCEDTPHSTQRHRVRLCLLEKDQIAQSVGETGSPSVAFDMVSEPPHSHRQTPFERCQWQQLRIYVPVAESIHSHRRRVSSSHAERPRALALSPSSTLCGLMQSEPSGALDCFHLGNSELTALKAESGHSLVDGSCLTLADALCTRDLTDEGKIFLAHRISRSMWEYYDSEWTRLRWSARDIQFVPQNNVSGNLLGDYNPTQPHITMTFEELSELDQALSLECASHSVLHGAPHILALGVILLNIFCSIPRRLKGKSYNTKTIILNNELKVSRDVMKQDDWLELQLPSEIIRKRVAEVLEACFDLKLYADSQNAEKRRQLLWEKIVSPLQWLVQHSGIEEKRALWVERGTAPVAIAGYGLLAHESAASSPTTWIDGIARSRLQNDIKERIEERAKNVRQWRRSRVAILDTGYCPDSIWYESDLRRNRIRSWQDFVPGSNDCVDTCGHGSHVLSCAMKIAPHADFYVARVARDDDGFDSAGEIVAKAIEWAVKTCECDIVSMSFGFRTSEAADATRAIGRAINQAITDREHRVLFFAAAANSGANENERFPASHDSVFAVRATDHEGTPQGFNPTIDREAADGIATLGKDVVGAWLPRIEQKAESGTSVATAIAAGMAALILDAANLTGAATDLPIDDFLQKLWTKRGMEKAFQIKDYVGRYIGRKLWTINAKDFCNLEAKSREAYLHTAALACR